MLLSVAEVRDYAVIAYSIAGVIAFILIAFFTLILGTVSYMMVNRVRRILKENVQPATENVRKTSESVRATTQFVSAYAITPVVKTYGVAAGARQFITVLARLRRSRGG